MLNIQTELDKDSYRSLSNFLKATNRNDINIVCGAGLSVSAGLPSWSNFIKKIISVFFLHWRMEERSNKKYKHVVPKNMSIAMAENIFFEDFEYEGIEQLLKEDSLIVAQLIKNCIEHKNWIWLLKKSLYDDYSEIDFNSEVIAATCDLVGANKEIFKSVMTYNYDNLIEHALNNIGIKTTSITSENHRKRNRHYPIYHLHGFLPIYGGGHVNKVYLSEDDYLTDITEPNSWYNQVHCSKLTSSCCLFVGLSFNDPSLKRKLAIHRISADHFHYALLTHKDTDYERKKFLLLKHELLRLNVRVIKYPYTNDHSGLSDLIRAIKAELSLKKQSVAIKERGLQNQKNI